MLIYVHVAIGAQTMWLKLFSQWGWTCEKPHVSVVWQCVMLYILNSYFAVLARFWELFPYLKRESRIVRAVYCLTIASPCLHSFSLAFQSLINTFSCVVRVAWIIFMVSLPSASFCGTTLSLTRHAGFFLEPLRYSRRPCASIDHIKQSL